MLVLSRKEKQEFLFPNLGITVQIVRVQGKKVSIGIIAPDDVRVLRSELAFDKEHDKESLTNKNTSHALRNQLHTLQLSLSLTQAQLEAGRAVDAEQTLTTALESFEELERLYAGNEKSGGSDSPTEGPRRALIVEDNAQERELLAEYLRVNGYQVDVACNGKAAMDYLNGHLCPDVVLLDINMPGMDGNQTARAIRQDPRFDKMKLFVISGSQPQTKSGQTSVFDDWFAKPISPREFVSRLDREFSTSVSGAA